MMKRLWKVKGIHEDVKVEIAIITSTWATRRTIERFCIESGLEGFDTHPMLDAELFDLETYDSYEFEDFEFYVKDWDKIKKTFKSHTLIQD